MAADDDDRIVPFQIEGADVRGRIVRLGPALDHVLTRHDYPEAVSHLLGEALLLGSLIGSGMKLRHKFTFQVQGDGPVTLLVADFTSAGTIRGYASFKVDEVTERGALPDAANRFGLLGGGYLAMTIDQGPNTEPYQGIVPLEGGSLAASAGGYFAQSEQVLTNVVIAVAQSYHRHAGGPKWRGGGIMLQRLGRAGQAAKVVAPEVDDDWQRASLLLETTEAHELTDPELSSERLLYRLFHEDGVRVFDSQPVSFACSCAAERVETVLRMHEPDTLREMIQDGVITAECQFCSTVYQFDPADFGVKD